MIKVSIIIPVYNVETYLSACLDSVLSQSLKEIEIICVDDASTDRSPEILKNYAQKDDRIRVITLPENHMQGYARNRGLEKAAGDYVYFLDADDMITQTAMEELYESAAKEKTDMIFFDSDVIFETEQLRKKYGSYLGVRSGNYPGQAVAGTELLDCFTANNEWLVYVQREFFDRQFLRSNKLRFPEGVEHEDELFSFQAVLLAKKARYLKKVWFIRRYRGNSVMTGTAQPKDFHGYFYTFCRMADFLETQKIDTEGTRECLSHIYECMKQFYPFFSGQENPADWFLPKELEKYRFFKQILQSEDAVKGRDRMLFGPLKDYRSVKLYGAGKIARNIFRRLTAQGLLVEAFIVTSKENNPETLFGLPVFEIENVVPDENSIILAAMAKGYHDEVTSLLCARRFPYFLYADNQLKGPFNVQD